MRIPESKGIASSSSPLEFAHEIDKRINARLGKCVVNGSADSTNQSMSFQPIEAGRCRFLIECLLQIFRRQPKCHIHQGSAIFLRRPSIESAAIDFRIELRGLYFVCCLNTGKSA